MNADVRAALERLRRFRAAGLARPRQAQGPCLTDEEQMAVAFGQLPVADYERHLDSCTSCADDVADLADAHDHFAYTLEGRARVAAVAERAATAAAATAGGPAPAAAEWRASAIAKIRAGMGALIPAPARLAHVSGLARSPHEWGEDDSLRLGAIAAEAGMVKLRFVSSDPRYDGLRLRVSSGEISELIEFVRVTDTLFVAETQRSFPDGSPPAIEPE